MTSGTNNVQARLKWSKNNTPESGPNRYIYRKIGTGSDAGAISVDRRFILEKGDILDFFFGSDSAPINLYIEKAEWSVQFISIITD